MRWPLRTQFVVVAIVAVHFWLARFDPLLATLVAGCTAAVTAIRVTRRSFQVSRPAASVTAIVAAMLVSSSLLTVLALAHVAFPDASQSRWHFGQGSQGVLLSTASGATFGFMASLPVVWVYGLVSLVRRPGRRRQLTRTAPRRRSKWHLAFTALVLSCSLYMAHAIFPHPIYTIPATMAILASTGLLFRVGWFIPCLTAGADVGVVLAELMRSGPLGWQMTVGVVAVFLGSLGGCVLGLLIDWTQRSREVDERNANQE